MRSCWVTGNHWIASSPIFRWYENDFGKRVGVRAFARRFFPEVADTTPLRFAEYDWSLNSQSGE